MRKPSDKQIAKEKAKLNWYEREHYTWWRHRGFFSEESALRYTYPVKSSEPEWPCDCMDVCECRVTRRMDAELAVELFASED